MDVNNGLGVDAARELKGGCALDPFE